MAFLIFLSLFIISVESKVYFHEKVDDGFLDRWVQSASGSVSKHGKFVVVNSEFEDGEYFIKTNDDSSHYQYGVQFDEKLDTHKNSLVLQYVVFHTQNLDCGGAYLKLYGNETDFKNFNGDSPYYIMFGPDFCGYSTRRIHLIINHGGKNHEITPEVSMVLDKKPHLYTLIIHLNKTFQILVDDELKRNGTLQNDFNILPPKMIPDPEDKKPEDWVENEYIPDPEDKKPEDWVELKIMIDPNATKPSDWNDETDGEWQPDSIPNPEYKGEWEPKTIKNPEYKGEWVAKTIPNPDYKEDSTIGNFKVQGAGFEIWQVKSGTQFDEISLSDDIDKAKEHTKLVMERIKKISGEIEKKEIAEREKVAEERKNSKVGENDNNEADVDDDEPQDASTTEDGKDQENDYKGDL